MIATYQGPGEIGVIRWTMSFFTKSVLATRIANELAPHTGFASGKRSAAWNITEGKNLATRLPIGTIFANYRPMNEISTGCGPKRMPGIVFDPAMDRAKSTEEEI